MQRLPTPRSGLLLGLLVALVVGPSGCGGGGAATADTYDFEVADVHNYLVSEYGALLGVFCRGGSTPFAEL